MKNKTMEKKLLPKDQSIVNQSAIKAAMEYLKMIGKTDVSINELLRLTTVFADFALYEKDDDYKKLVKAADDWLKSKK